MNPKAPREKPTPFARLVKAARALDDAGTGIEGDRAYNRAEREMIKAALRMGLSEAGRKGGLAFADKLCAKQRSELGRRLANARWAKARRG